MNSIFKKYFSDKDYEALHAPTEQALGLPPDVYYEGEIWELEREKIFSANWIVCAFESDLPEPNSVYPVSVCGWEIVLTRDSNGQIYAFHNICQHRSMKVVNQPCNVEKLVCPWHAWTYDVKGNLVATPQIGGKDVHKQSGLVYENLGLTPIRCDSWLGFIYINIDGKAQPLANQFSSINQTLQDYDLDLLRFAQTSTALDFMGNWKLVVEGGLENYHLPWVHPEAGGHSGISREESDEEGGYFGMATLWEREEPDENKLLLPKFPHLKNVRIKEGYSWEDYYLFAFPGTTIVEFMANHVIAVAVIPISPTKTIMRRSAYFISDEAMTPKYDEIRRNVIRFWDRIGEQDLSLVATVQEQQHQRKITGTPTRFSSYWESAVHRFQKHLVKHLM